MSVPLGVSVGANPSTWCYSIRLVRGVNPFTKIICLSFRGILLLRGFPGGEEEESIAGQQTAIGGDSPAGTGAPGDALDGREALCEEARHPLGIREVPAIGAIEEATRYLAIDTAEPLPADRGLLDHDGIPDGRTDGYGGCPMGIPFTPQRPWSGTPGHLSGGRLGIDLGHGYDGGQEQDGDCGTDYWEATFHVISPHGIGRHRAHWIGTPSPDQVAARAVDAG